MICVGIDIAKGKSTVCFLRMGGEVLKTAYDIEHTAEEITKLIRDISKAKTDKIDSMKIAAFGLTYWQDLKRPSRPTRYTES